MYQSGRFPVGDKYLDKYLAGGNYLEAIEDVLKENYLSIDEIEKCVAASFFELERREKHCDVIISDYLRKNYRERQLFYSANHPVNMVIEELARRILNYIGINDDEFDMNNNYVKGFTLKGQDIPVYPSVIRALELKEYETEYFANRYFWNFKGNAKQFLKKYVEVCWLKVPFMKKRFPFSKIKQNSRIIIYGAGVAGKRCYSQAVLEHYCVCLYFVDKRSAEIKKDSISVYGMDTLYAQPTSDYDYVLVAIDDDAISEDVRYELISGGIASEKIVLQEDVLIDH